VQFRQIAFHIFIFLYIAKVQYNSEYTADAMFYVASLLQQTFLKHWTVALNFLIIMVMMVILIKGIYTLFVVFGFNVSTSFTSDTLLYSIQLHGGELVPVPWKQIVAYFCGSCNLKLFFDLRPLFFAILTWLTGTFCIGQDKACRVLLSLKGDVELTLAIFQHNKEISLVCYYLPSHLDHVCPLELMMMGV